MSAGLFDIQIFRKRGTRLEEYAQSLPRSPERTTMAQMVPGVFPGYTQPGYYTPVQPSTKRARTSVDTVYEQPDARFSHTYQQSMYPPQAGTYQGQMGFGYSTGQSTVMPEYGIRQQPTMAPAGSSYGTSEDPMLAMRSPSAAGYINPQRGYPPYTSAQIPYGLPSQPMTQLSDSQRNQATLQPLVTGQSVNPQTTV